MIGRRWKCGNAWSLTILIGRGLDFKVLRRKGPRDIHHPLFFMCGCQGASLENLIPFPVAMAKGSHLFPYRTQKLSPSAPMVLGWTRPGRIGRRRIPMDTRSSVLFLCLFGWMQKQRVSPGCSTDCSERGCVCIIRQTGI